MGDYFDHLNYFFKFAQSRNLPASARITYLAILYKWNETRRETSFSLSDRELSSLTGLSIGRVITTAKRQLKNFGLIDFKSTKHGTRYFFKQNSGTRQISNNAAPLTAETPQNGYITNTQNISKKEERTRKGGREEGENLAF